MLGCPLAGAISEQHLDTRPKKIPRCLHPQRAKLGSKSCVHRETEIKRDVRFVLDW